MTPLVHAVTNAVSKPSVAQLLPATSLVWQLASLRDRAWTINANILVACGTTKLYLLPAITVDRINRRLRSRIELIKQVH